MIIRLAKYMSVGLLFGAAALGIQWLSVGFSDEDLGSCATILIGIGAAAGAAACVNRVINANQDWRTPRSDTRR
jgi:hypothetical protein